jgi:hypothetical protein
VRGDSFRADWRNANQIQHATACEAPESGAICPDDGPEFTALEDQVRASQREKPRKAPGLARRTQRSGGDGCAAPL